jgi:nitric oxide dioxygenase
MNEQIITTIKSTIPILREHGMALTTYFYQRMLSAHPELKNIFNLNHQASGQQPRALAASVLAYAEHIDNPALLAAAIERIAIKHVSLNVQAEQYAIVGEHLLHSISEVLALPMQHAVIGAWQQAYSVLAQILIEREQQLYQKLREQAGGWVGWRSFTVSDKRQHGNALQLSFRPLDHLPIASAQADDFVSIKVHIPELEIEQPMQFRFDRSQNSTQYQILIHAESRQTSRPSVAHQLIENVNIGDVVQISAPLNQAMVEKNI